MGGRAQKERLIKNTLCGREMSETWTELFMREKYQKVTREGILEKHCLFY